MIGFAGAPFTVASYMIEGSGSKNYTEVKKLMYTDPGTFTALLEKLSEVTFEYLQMQVQAGAETLMLFDSWVANVAHDDYLQHVFPTTAALIQKVKTLQVPVIYFPGQGSDHLHQLKDITADVIAIDWKIPLDKAVSILTNQGLHVSVQGNLDPQSLLAPKEVLEQKVRDIVRRGKTARGHIFNVGHGLLPHTPPEALTTVIETIRQS
jgi:uroporphyrinogen decarboxylase